MPCFHPLTGYYSKEVGKSGKRGIVFDRNAAFSGVKLSLPCGQCIGCRLERSRQWAVRCMHEKQLHDMNCFITLTYDDKHLPEGGTLVKRDLQLFFKRLRKKVGKVRFYACGEYGERNRRPHYHAIIFGYEPSDCRLYKRTPSGSLFTSRILEGVWGNGFVVVGNVDFDSCAYVARYIMKKVTGKNAENFYSWIDEDGVCRSMLPEFTNMSRGGRNGPGGIGKGWFDKYGRQTYIHDSVVMNGKEIRPPRYYDTKYEVIDCSRVAALKVTRRRKALEHRDDNTSERRKVREIVTNARLALKGRTI